MCDGVGVLRMRNRATATEDREDEKEEKIVIRQEGRKERKTISLKDRTAKNKPKIKKDKGEEEDKKEESKREGKEEEKGG